MRIFDDQFFDSSETKIDKQVNLPNQYFSWPSVQF